MTDLLDSLATDRLIHAHQLNLLNDRALLVRFDVATLSDHSFLDQRAIRRDHDYEWHPWEGFASVAQTLPDGTPAYLFHVGHCGSTLISRLIREASGALALREPLPLRTLAIDRAFGQGALLTAAERQTRLGLLGTSWSRGSEPTVIKATSFCCNLIDDVAAGAPTVFISQRPETHLAVILAGENALADLRGFGNYRFLRLVQAGIELPELASLSIGELAALSLLAEVHAAATSTRAGDMLRVDFDRFLEQPVEELSAVGAHLGLSIDPARCRAAVDGPTLTRYSKAPEHAYGPGLRSDIIADSRAGNGGEIAAGMAFLERLSREDASVSAALDWLEG